MAHDTGSLDSYYIAIINPLSLIAFFQKLPVGNKDFKIENMPCIGVLGSLDLIKLTAFLECAHAGDSQARQAWRRKARPVCFIFRALPVRLLKPLITH